MAKPVEISLFDFLTDKISASAVDSVIYGLELHDTIYQLITKSRGIRISDVVGSFSPAGTATESEYDVFISLSCFAKVEGKNQKARQPALTQVFDIQQAVYGLLRADASLGGRVCDSVLLRGARGYESLDSQPYAVAIIEMVINPTGANYTNS